MKALHRLETLSKFWRGVVVLLIVAAIVLFCVGAMLPIMALVTTPVHADENRVSKDEALVVFTDLHNAGLLLDVTLAGGPWAGELSADSSYRFRLEDVDGSVSDGFASFVRVSGKLRAVLLESPMSALERLGLACQGQAGIAALLRPINTAKVARSFVGVLIPEVPVDGWGAKVTITTATLGRASVLLRHREGELEISVELGMLAVKRDGSWKLEAYSFRVERKQIQPRLE